MHECKYKRNYFDFFLNYKYVTVLKHITLGRYFFLFFCNIVLIHFRSIAFFNMLGLPNEKCRYESYKAELNGLLLQLLFMYVLCCNLKISGLVQFLKTNFFVFRRWGRRCIAPYSSRTRTWGGMGKQRSAAQRNHPKVCANINIHSKKGYRFSHPQSGIH